MQKSRTPKGPRYSYRSQGIHMAALVGVPSVHITEYAYRSPDPYRSQGIFMAAQVGFPSLKVTEYS